MVLKHAIAATLLAALSLSPALAQSSIKSAGGQQLLDTYIAHISPRDLVNSNGQKLTEAWQVLRQDRANFHSLGKGDADDQYDIFFADKNNRAIMEDWLRKGAITPEAARAIMRGNVEVFVEIYGRNGNGESIQVTVHR